MSTNIAFSVTGPGCYVSCFHYGLTFESVKGSECIFTKHFEYNPDCIHLLQSAPKFVVDKWFSWVLKKLLGLQYCLHWKVCSNTLPCFHNHPEQCFISRRLISVRTEKRASNPLMNEVKRKNCVVFLASFKHVRKKYFSTCYSLFMSPTAHCLNV